MHVLSTHPVKLKTGHVKILTLTMEQMGGNKLGGYMGNPLNLELTSRNLGFQNI